MAPGSGRVWTPSHDRRLARPPWFSNRKAAPASWAIGRRAWIALSTSSARAARAESRTEATSPAESARSKDPTNRSKETPPERRSGGVIRQSLGRTTATSLIAGAVDVDDAIEQCERLFLWPLEGVAPDDRAGGAAISQCLDLLEKGIGALGAAAREDDEAPTGKRRLHHVGDASGKGRDIDALLFVDLAGFLLFDVVGRRLHLDDVRAEQRGHVSRISGHVDRRFALLREVAAPWIGPDDDGEAQGFRLLCHLPDFFNHREAIVGAWVDRETDGRATEAEGVPNATRKRLVLGRRVAVRRVDLEDGRISSREGIGSCFQQPQRCCKGIEARIDR